MGHIKMDFLLVYHTPVSDTNKVYSSNDAAHIQMPAQTILISYSQLYLVHYFSTPNIHH